MRKHNYQRSRRLRVFGGPNGSGKSTILNQINDRFNLGHYINADDIEKILKFSEYLDLTEYGISDLTKQQFKSYQENHTLIKKAAKDGFPIDLYYEDGKIFNPNQNSHSYEAAFLADVLRQELYKRGKKFAYETVMSHKSKIDFLKSTMKAGYKNYLYYISTESPSINIERVKQRVILGGHPVPEHKIKTRYYNSLSNLKSAVQMTYRTFVFDNSGKKPILILGVFEGKEVTFHHNEIPHWVDQYLLS